MTGKTDKHLLFEVQLDWLAGSRGILSAEKTHGTIYVATPSEFGGEENMWSPEHLFLSAVSSCFMTTYLAFAKKLQFEISELRCSAIGQIEIVNGKYKFTHIDLYPKVFIADEALKEKANLAMEKTHKYCLVSNSVNADVFYHSEVFTEPVRRQGISGEHSLKITFSDWEAKEIGDRLGMDFKKYNLQEFRRGLEMEMGHGNYPGETGMMNDDEYIAGKIARANLNGMPDYYSRMDKMEKEATGMIQNN